MNNTMIYRGSDDHREEIFGCKEKILHINIFCMDVFHIPAVVSKVYGR